MKWAGVLASVGLTIIFIGVFTVMPAMQYGGISYVATGLNASDVEHHIHLYTNEQRTYGGLHPLERVSTIDGIARGHSEDMMSRDYFDHDTPEGLDPTARGKAAGYECRKDYGSYYTYGLGENIHHVVGRGGTAKDVAQYIVSEWMQSPGHRANIMDSAYDKIGVGVAVEGRSGVYSTQNFC